jgi:Protein of unknown function (DUF3892)
MRLQEFASDILPEKFLTEYVRVAVCGPHRELGTILCPHLKGSIMAEVQVTCITKPHPQSPHEHITHLGNPKAGWTWPRERVIQSIDAKTNNFFVVDPRTGTRANIGVVRAAGHAPYVRTYADGVWNDNLLSLNQCPL